jgi:trk system potassium uptake protein TrkH
MQGKTIFRVVGILLAVFSLTMIPPVIIAFIYGDGGAGSFVLSFCITLVTGVALWQVFRWHREELRVRDGFLIVVLFWTVLSLFGALPFYAMPGLGISFTNAVFESFSGLTTTGATVLNDLDAMPHAVLFYRQLLQWLGGMGIIVLAVAVLPMLGVGGMLLYRAEIPGPVKDAKLTPRIAETAKTLWYIYFGLTVACTVAYWLAGMSLFDAIGHSFSTVSLGGFSTHDANIGHFNSATIELICVFFMLISGTKFSLHYLALQRRHQSAYTEDPEWRVFLIILGGVAVYSFVGLVYANAYDIGEAWHYAVFQAVSIGITAGFSATAYEQWPSALLLILLFASFIGGCTGSTAGGVKVIRVILLVKHALREIQRLIHPNGIFVIRIGKATLPDKVLEAMWGFFAIYLACFALMMLVLTVDGLDLLSAFAAVAACLNNLGHGFWEVGSHYDGIGTLSKWSMCVAMLLGRLEIFTLLVLFVPDFWKR